MSDPIEKEEKALYSELRERFLDAFETTVSFGLFFISIFVYTMLTAFGAGIIYALFK